MAIFVCLYEFFKLADIRFQIFVPFKFSLHRHYIFGVSNFTIMDCLKIALKLIQFGSQVPPFSLNLVQFCLSFNKTVHAHFDPNFFHFWLRIAFSHSSWTALLESTLERSTSWLFVLEVGAVSVWRTLSLLQSCLFIRASRHHILLISLGNFVRWVIITVWEAVEACTYTRSAATSRILRWKTHTRSVHRIILTATSCRALLSTSRPRTTFAHFVSNVLFEAFVVHV